MASSTAEPIEAFTSTAAQSYAIGTEIVSVTPSHNSADPFNATDSSLQPKTVNWRLFVTICVIVLFGLLVVVGLIFLVLWAKKERKRLGTNDHILRFLCNRFRYCLYSLRNRIRFWFTAGGFENFCTRLSLFFCMPIVYIFCGLCALMGFFKPPDPGDLNFYGVGSNASPSNSGTLTLIV